MQVSALYRHPLKGVGYEPVPEATLAPGQTFPGDRIWAIAHAGAKIEPGAWAHSSNFMRGAKSAALMQVEARLEGDRLRLSHPQRPAFEGAPDDPADAARLIDWVAPLCYPGRAGPDRVIRAGRLGMTDGKLQGLSLASTASLAALSDKAGRPLARPRFRANLWFDGGKPFAELDWVGRRIAIGEAVLEVAGKIDRCTATHVNPATGMADTDVLSLLDTHWGHDFFGVECRVVAGGAVRPGLALSLR